MISIDASSYSSWIGLERRPAPLGRARGRNQNGAGLEITRQIRTKARQGRRPLPALMVHQGLETIGFRRGTSISDFHPVAAFCGLDPRLANDSALQHTRLQSMLQSGLLKFSHVMMDATERG